MYRITYLLKFSCRKNGAELTTQTRNLQWDSAAPSRTLLQCCGDWDGVPVRFPFSWANALAKHINGWNPSMPHPHLETAEIIINTPV